MTIFRPFSFWVCVYVSGDAVKRLHPGHVTEFAFSEHEARRSVLSQYHAAGVFVFSIERDER